MKIVVLAGGLSGERNVSLSSGAMICTALRAQGHQAVLVDLFLGLDGNVSSLFAAPPPLPDPAIAAVEPDLVAVRAARPGQRGIFGTGVLDACTAADAVFLALHGDCGEDGRVQAAFDLMGIVYTGSGYLGSAVAMHKPLTKQAARAYGIATPDWRMETVRADNLDEIAGRTALPCVVKVPDGGSSIGVSICMTSPELAAALAAATGSEVMIEPYVQGREFSCGVLDGASLPPIEIIPSDGFYDYRNKYQKGAAKEVCPADIPPEAEQALRDMALGIHTALGLSAYSRSDFIMDETGAVHFLEVNTLPGMTPTSLLPQEAAAAGIDYGALCMRILDIALRERGGAPCI